MKKYIAIAALCAVGGLVLACSGAPNESSATSEEEAYATGGPVTPTGCYGKSPDCTWALVTCNVPAAQGTYIVQQLEGDTWTDLASTTSEPAGYYWFATVGTYDQHRVCNEAWVQRRTPMGTTWVLERACSTPFSIQIKDRLTCWNPPPPPCTKAPCPIQ